MLLDATTEKVRAVLAGVVTTNQLQCSTSWADHRGAPVAFTPGNTLILTNSTTEVDIVPAPASGFQRQVKDIVIYNTDTVAATVIVEIWDGTNRWKQIRATLTATDWVLHWHWSDGVWRVYNNAGILQ